MTEALTITDGQIKLTVDAQTGVWQSLTGGKSERNWLRSDVGAAPGLPFVSGSAVDPGQRVAVQYQQFDDTNLAGTSHRGEIRTSLTLEDGALCCALRMPDRRGPRAGWVLDLDHLDLPGGSIHEQLMPVMVDTASDLSWAYLVWQRAEDDLLVVAIHGPFAAWLIDYSYAGHRMEGLQVLARADDVLCPAYRFPDCRLPHVTDLRVSFAIVHSREEALKKVASLLELAIHRPLMTGVVAGATVPLQHYGYASRLTHVAPHGEEVDADPNAESITLMQPGVHILRSYSAFGQIHESRILALGDWREQADKVLTFYRKYFQFDCGAFARIIRTSTRKPDGRQVAGFHFGNPEELNSCRTGEFGGFGAWAQLKHIRAFGENPVMADSVTRYFEWLTNKGREDNPRPNTLCFTEHSYNDRTYSPYHFFNEINYAQHETWLIGQMAEAIDMGQTALLDHLDRFVQHYMSDHMDDNGVIWNQNWAEETPVDYCTVDAPPVHLIAAAKTLIREERPSGTTLLALTRKSMEHLCNRGFDFPTEGEPCTEDGSIACQAWALARGYNELEDPDPAWLQMARDLMAYHAKLELSGCDIRSDGSSLRFWETMYESDSYGPSINASHGWTIWSACARWEIYRATGDFTDLWQVWRHTTCVAHRIREDGGMPPCYTPDLIPAPMHDDSWGDPDKRAEGRMTTSTLAWGYPSVYSMSGMHLFVLAPYTWYHTCGYDPQSGRVANGLLNENTLTPHTPLPCSRIALGSAPQEPLRVCDLATSGPVLLTLAGAADTLKVEGAASVTQLDANTLQLTDITSGKITVTV